MPFGVVSGFGRGMGVLDRGGDRRRGTGSFAGLKVEHPIVTNVILCERVGDAALPKLLWDFLFHILTCFYFLCDYVVVVRRLWIIIRR